LRILWVKANKILPPHSGGDIRSYQILRRLASIHELVFFSYYDGEPDTEYEANSRDSFLAQFASVPGNADSTRSGVAWTIFFV
jgi:hypothetical protein